MKGRCYAPPAEARSGVARYAAELAQALRRRSFSRNLYHVGNNALHLEAYRECLRNPGVVILHDALLQHFFLASMTPGDYVEEFVFNYGEWSRPIALQLYHQRGSANASAAHFQYPMLRRLAESGNTIVVHNQAAAGIVLRHGAARVRVIPHLFAPPELPEAPEIERWRSERGIRPSHTLFGVFGYLRESKRILPILRVFSKLRSERSDVWLLLAGEAGSTDLTRALSRLPDGVLRVGYLPEPQWWFHAAAVDAAINLRYPSAGESSGITTRLMGISKPVVVTASLENAELPGVCPRVNAGPGEEMELFELLRWMAANPVRLRQMGEAAAQHIASLHALPAVAAALLEELLAETPATAAAGTAPAG